MSFLLAGPLLRLTPCNLSSIRVGHNNGRRYDATAGRFRAALLLLVFRLGVEHNETVRHDAAVTGPSHRRGRVAEPGVRVLAPDGRVATGDAVGTAVARDDGRRTTAIRRDATLEAQQTVLRRSTGQWRSISASR